jgi:hypothetical protein
MNTKFVTVEGNVVEGVALTAEEAAILESPEVMDINKHLRGSYVLQCDVVKITAYLLSLYHFTARTQTQELTQPGPGPVMLEPTPSLEATDDNDPF